MTHWTVPELRARRARALLAPRALALAPLALARITPSARALLALRTHTHTLLAPRALALLARRGFSLRALALAALLALPAALAACPGGGNSGGQGDAGPRPDGQALPDAHVSEDASTPGGGTISIYLTGDLSAKTFTDGLSGQTPTRYVVALSEYFAQTSLDDPAPAFCFSTGGAPVEADLAEDTLVGTCRTADLPTSIYTHGRVKIDWATYTVTGTLHYQGMPLPGELTFFRAYSDTTYQGQPYSAGEGTVTFTGATTVTIPMAYDPPLSLPGVRLETIDGEFFMTFPYSNPLAVDQTSPDHHWARAHWEIFEGFRWQDEATAGYAAAVWDVAPTEAETEPVLVPGVTGYHTTASTD